MSSSLALNVACWVRVHCSCALCILGVFNQINERCVGDVICVPVATGNLRDLSIDVPQ